MSKKNDKRVQEMYELYKDGYSLEKVGVAFGISRQAVYKMFKRRGYKTRPRAWLPYIMWDKRKYSLRSNGYYARTTKERGLLHRDKWEYYNGKIPIGYQIHHKDNNKLNNDIDNLELIHEVDHSYHHLHTCPKCGYKFNRNSK